MECKARWCKCGKFPGSIELNSTYWETNGDLIVTARVTLIYEFYFRCSIPTVSFATISLTVDVLHPSLGSQGNFRPDNCATFQRYAKIPCDCLRQAPFDINELSIKVLLKNGWARRRVARESKSDVVTYIVLHAAVARSLAWAIRNLFHCRQCCGCRVVCAGKVEE